MTESNKYQNGKIYKIVDCGYNKCYIGSTCNTLAKRISWHRSHYNQYKTGKTRNIKVYDLFEEFGVDNCKIELIEQFPCENKDELHKREGYHIQSNECVNRCVAGRTIKDSNKEYYNKNKDNILNQKKEYYNQNRDDILVKKKNYHDQNKDAISIRKKEYYSQNKDALISKASEQIRCPHCGYYCRRSDIARHNRSQRHLTALSNSTGSAASSHSSASSVSDPSHDLPDFQDDQEGSQV